MKILQQQYKILISKLKLNMIWNLMKTNHILSKVCFETFYKIFTLVEIKSHKKRKKRKKTISSEKSHRSTDNYVDIKEVKIEQMEVLHAPSLIVNPLPEPEPNLEPLPEQDSIKIWD